MSSIDEWIWLLILPEQAVSAIRPPTSISSAPIPPESFYRAAHAFRLSAIGQDPDMLQRLKSHLLNLRTQKPSLQHPVPSRCQRAWDFISDSCGNSSQQNERDVARYIDPIMVLLLELLKELDPTTADYTESPESTSQLAVLGLKPDIAFQAASNQIKFLMELETTVVLDHYRQEIASLTQSFDWATNELDAIKQCRRAPLSIFIKLYAFMKHNNLPYSFLFSGSEYCVVQLAQPANGPVICLSPLVSIAHVDFPLIPIVLATLLVQASDEGTLPNNLQVPHTTLINILNAPCHRSDSAKVRRRTATHDSGVFVGDVRGTLMFEDPSKRAPSDARGFRAHKNTFIKDALLTVQQHVSTSETAKVFIGIYGNEKVAVKMASKGNETGQMLLAEGERYLAMRDLYDVAIPACLGLLEGEMEIVLVTRWFGQRVKEWSDLTVEQSRTLYSHLRAVHRAGFSHQDLAPRNVLVNDAGEVRLLDFSHAFEHRCGGSSKCSELRDARRILSIPPKQSKQ